MHKHHWIALAIFLGVGIGLAAALVLLLAPASYAGIVPGSNLDEQTLNVAKGLYCPVCPGVPLDVCDTQACDQWRALIKQRLSEGQTATQIEAYFVAQYGERVLGAPRAQGFNLLIYILPAFAVSAGAAALYLFAQKRMSLSPASAQPNAASANQYRSRIERELQEND
jgi:cytochrome c-type biogenesis protein CcmH